MLGLFYKITVPVSQLSGGWPFVSESLTHHIIKEQYYLSFIESGLLDGLPFSLEVVFLWFHENIFT